MILRTKRGCVQSDGNLSIESDYFSFADASAMDDCVVVDSNGKIQRRTKFILWSWSIFCDEKSHIYMKIYIRRKT